MGNSQEQWDQLAIRLRAGDHQAAVELVENYSKSIYLFFRRLGHNRQTSEDLAQETFFQAWQHIGQLRSHVMLKSWLYRIAANISNMHWRSLKDEELSSLSINPELDFTDNGLRFFEQTENSEQMRNLKKIVDNLPVKLKQAVVLHYMQELTIKEAADALSIWQGTYKSRLNRALKIIRVEMNEESKD